MSRMEEIIQRGISDAGLSTILVIDGAVEGLKLALRRTS